MVMLTPEEKARWAPMLQQTFEAIAPDVHLEDDDDRVGTIIEVTCDANHPEIYGGMTRAEYQVLCTEYHDPDTRAWLRQVLNY